jgi:hypothetical protein
MKRVLLSLLVLGVCTIMNAQLLNGGFETWTTNSYTILPSPPWGSSNSNQLHDDISVTAVTQSIDKHGDNYAAKLTNSVDITGNIIPGMIITELSQLPASFSLWIKPNNIAGDATVAMLFYRNAGVDAGTQKWELPGTSLVWTQHVCSGITTPGFAYDEVFLVVSSTKADKYEASTMTGFIGSYVLVDDVEVTGAAINDNNGLETWETLSSALPDNWTIPGGNYFNIYVSPGTLPIEKVAEGHTGSAIKITTTPDSDEKYLYNYCINEISNEFAWTLTSLTGKITGYYKYIPKVTNETALVEIQFLDNGGNSIGSASTNLSAQAEYTEFAFNYNLTSTPVSARIKIMASSQGVNTNNTGTVLFIDDIEVLSTTTATDSNKAALSASVSPNPCTDNLTVILNNTQAGTVKAEVYDLAGNLIRSTTNNGAQQSFNLSIADIANGVYLLKLTSDNHVTTTRFVKK